MRTSVKESMTITNRNISCILYIDVVKTINHQNTTTVHNITTQKQKSSATIERAFESFNIFNTLNGGNMHRSMTICLKTVTAMSKFSV